MQLPSLDVLDVPQECQDCGEPIRLIDPPFCAACDDRRKSEAIRDSGNVYRRNAYLALELAEVRRRARVYIKGKR